jgi:hypothetical protein
MKRSKALRVPEYLQHIVQVELPGLRRQIATLIGPPSAH